MRVQCAKIHFFNTTEKRRVMCNVKAQLWRTLRCSKLPQAILHPFSIELNSYLRLYLLGGAIRV
jgi:hypothetical protein